MTGQEFEAIIERLGFSQVGAARFFHYNESTVRRWISGEYSVPYLVEMVLRLMVRYNLTPDSVVSVIESKRGAGLRTGPPNC